MKQILLLPLLAGCLLLGCSQSDVPVPSTPSPAASDDGAVKGTDVNGNHVRDDIDRLIAQKYAKTPEMARAAQQKAASLQAMMEATTQEEAMAAAQQVSRASACVRDTLPGPENQEIRVAMAHELEAETVNSPQRQRAYLRAHQLLGGGYFPEPKIPLCD